MVRGASLAVSRRRLARLIEQSVRGTRGVPPTARKADPLTIRCRNAVDSRLRDPAHRTGQLTYS